MQFQVCIQNRYKLNKKYRKLLPSNPDETETLEQKTLAAQAKVKGTLTDLGKGEQGARKNEQTNTRTDERKKERKE